MSNQIYAHLDTQIIYAKRLLSIKLAIRQPTL